MIPGVPASCTQDDIDAAAAKAPTAVSLKELYEFGKEANERTILAAARFLHREVPIRLAHMANMLRDLPVGLANLRPIRMVHSWYLMSFSELVASPVPDTMEREEEFRQLIANIKMRHDHVMETMAEGLLEFKGTEGYLQAGPELQRALDHFYMARISIRVLLGQHVALRRPRPGWVGIICGHTPPARVAQDAIAAARDLSRVYYGGAPAIEVLGNTDLTFTYIPSHLHHILIELLKNSVRAAMEFHGARKRAIPPVRIILAGGAEDVTMKISDEGGGIPRSGIDRIWTYLYTTAQLPAVGPQSRDVQALAGYGFGLPLSRLYARYLGGDLQIMSMDGYGTDAYLHLGRLGTHREVL